MEEICTFCEKEKVKMECLTCGMTSCCSDVCLSRVHKQHAAMSKKMKHTAEMKNMSEESGETEETEKPIKCKIHKEEEMKEVTDVEWMVKRGIPQANAQRAFNDIERLRKLAKENPECLLM